MKNNTLEAAKAAIYTLESMGYTYLGGRAWKPPLGLTKHPDSERLAFILQNQVQLEMSLDGWWVKYKYPSSMLTLNKLYKTPYDAIDAAIAEFIEA